MAVASPDIRMSLLASSSTRDWLLLMLGVASATVCLDSGLQPAPRCDAKAAASGACSSSFMVSWSTNDVVANTELSTSEMIAGRQLLELLFKSARAPPEEEARLRKP